MAGVYAGAPIVWTQCHDVFSKTDTPMNTGRIDELYESFGNKTRKVQRSTVRKIAVKEVVAYEDVWKDAEGGFDHSPFERKTAYADWGVRFDPDGKLLPGVDPTSPEGRCDHRRRHKGVYGVICVGCGFNPDMFNIRDDVDEGWGWDDPRKRTEETKGRLGSKIYFAHAHRELYNASRKAEADAKKAMKHVQPLSVWRDQARRYLVSNEQNKMRKGETVELLSIGASGLKWCEIGSARPNGKELNNDKLANALQVQTEFDQTEWRGFGLKQLSTMHFIKAGGSYFQPCEASRSKAIVDTPMHTELNDCDVDDMPVMRLFIEFTTKLVKLEEAAAIMIIGKRSDAENKVPVKAADVGGDLAVIRELRPPDVLIIFDGLARRGRNVASTDIPDRLKPMFNTILRIMNDETPSEAIFDVQKTMVDICTEIQLAGKRNKTIKRATPFLKAFLLQTHLSPNIGEGESVFRNRVIDHLLRHAAGKDHLPDADDELWTCVVDALKK